MASLDYILFSVTWTRLANVHVEATNAVPMNQQQTTLTEFNLKECQIF